MLPFQWQKMNRMHDMGIVDATTTLTSALIRTFWCVGKCCEEPFACSDSSNLQPWSHRLVHDIFKQGPTKTLSSVTSRHQVILHHIPIFVRTVHFQGDSTRVSFNRRNGRISDSIEQLLSLLTLYSLKVFRYHSREHMSEMKFRTV